MTKIRTLFSIIAGKDNIEDIIETQSDKKIVAQTPGTSKEFIFADQQKVIEEHRKYSDKINSLLDTAMRNYQQGQYDAAISGYDEFFMVLKEADAHLERIKKDINEWMAAQPNEKGPLNFVLTDIKNKDSVTSLKDNTLASAYVMRANANLKLKKPAEAMHDFVEALRYDPKRENVPEMIDSLQKEIAAKEKITVDKTEYEQLKRSKEATDELLQLIKAEKPTYEDVDTSGFDKLLDKNKPHQTAAPAGTKTDWTSLVVGIILTVLLGGGGVGIYVLSQTHPAGKSKKEQEYVRTYQSGKTYHIDAIVNDTAYAIPDAKGKDISKYQLVVRMILANQEDFRMDIAKDALEDFLRFINISEMYDKENKTFDFGRGYYPREFVRLAQAAADDNNTITKDSLSKIKEKKGYKQIVGEK